MNNTNPISKYYLHFAKGNKKELDDFGRKFKKNKREKLKQLYKLFFLFIVVRAEELSLDYNKNVETKLK